MFNRDRVPQLRGSATQIFMFECVALVLLNFHENKTVRFLRHGQFEVNIITQTSTKIFMSTVKVRDMEWLIAKDAPVIRLGQRSFAFGMPGLLFGVQFPPSCSEDTMDTLERVLIRFSNYTDFHVRNEGYPFADNDLNFWTNIRPRVVAICHSKLARYGHLFRRPPIPGGDSAYLLRAYRTCVVSEVMTIGILTGFLKSSDITILDSRRLKERARKIHVFNSEDIYPSIDVVSDTVQILEMTWMVATGQNLSQGVATQPQAEAITITPRRFPFKHWKLTEPGMTAFVCTPDDENPRA